MKVQSFIDVDTIKQNEVRKSKREVKEFYPVAKVKDDIHVGWYLFTKAQLKRGQLQADNNSEDTTNLEFEFTEKESTNKLLSWQGVLLFVGGFFSGIAYVTYVL